MLGALIVMAFSNCEKNEDLQFSEVKTLSLEGQGSNSDFNTLSVFDAPYLTFKSMDEYIQVRDEVEAVFLEQEDDDIEVEMPQSYLTRKSESPGFTSYTEFIEEQEEMKLEGGWSTLDALHGDYLTDKDEAYLLNEFGVVGIGDSVIMAGPFATYRAELSHFEDLINASTNGIPSTNVKITSRSGNGCPVSFSVNVNHANRTAVFNYTGTDPNGSNLTELTWDISGQAGNSYTNQTSFSVQFPSPGVTYQATATFRERGIITTYVVEAVQVDSNTVRLDTVDIITRTGIVCSNSMTTDFEIGVCNVDFRSSEGIDGLYQFTSTASVPFGNITGYQWQFGDGQTSNQQNPTIQFPCDRNFTATLTVFSPDCPNGSESISKEVSVSGFECCDKNSDMSWADSPTWDGGDKKISYRYDLGSEIVPWEQRIKAEMKNYKKNNKGKWKKDKARIQARFTGTLFAKDEDDCTCQDPIVISASPSSSVNKKKDTFKDKLDGLQSREDWHKIKRDEPVIIEYLVDGTIRQAYDTGTGSGYECE